VKSRGIAAVLTLALMAAGTGGVIAGGAHGGGNGSASNSQYKPPNHPGCHGHGPGDSNHGGKHEKWRNCAG
jgi:hypothetical protein